MVNEILTAAGIQGRRGRFTGKAPATYVVWLDDVTTEQGPDPLSGVPQLRQHDISLELYETKPDDAAETALEVAMSDKGLNWTKQDRYWLQSEQLYQVVYEFTFYEKRRA